MNQPGGTCFSLFLWGIWLRRNAWVFEKKNVLEIDLIKKVVNVVGCYKVNSDAAFFLDGYVGLGGVMRDHTGDVMATTNLKQKGNGNVDVAEALAARHAVSIALEAGLDTSWKLTA
uniref:RNase H type-1 domain-containing protein n=1 Tax=Chenopodium quinoa TaxID=63459 RepID=A0A803MN90_CHEQI